MIGRKERLDTRRTRGLTRIRNPKPQKRFPLLSSRASGFRVELSFRRSGVVHTRATQLPIFSSSSAYPYFYEYGNPGQTERFRGHAPTQLPIFSSPYPHPYFYEYKSISNSVSVSRGIFQPH
jgi:hypothetical protein